MRRGFPLGSIAGVSIRVGPSWLLIAPLIGVGLHAGIPVGAGPGWARAAVAAAGAALVLLSVIIHELGHVYVAERRDVRVDRIVVVLLGGYTDMDLDSNPPGDEAAVAVAGPIASLLFAGVLAGLALVVPDTSGIERATRVVVMVNVAVVAFNLLPVYPLDGGRIVHSLLIRRGWAPRRAEEIGFRLALAVGIALLALGVWAALAESTTSVLVLPAAAIVVVIAAGSRPVSGPRAFELMEPVGELLREADVLGERTSNPIPVTSSVGRVVGVVPPGTPSGALAGEVMRTVAPADLVQPSQRLGPLEARRRHQGQSLLVVDEGMLIGVIPPETE